MLQAFHRFLVLGLIGCALSATGRAGSYDQAVESVAEVLAGVLKQDGVSSIKPHFLGLPGMPNGASAGFTERLKEHLAPHGIQISRRASHAFVAQLKRADVVADGFALRLSGTVMDGAGREVRRIAGYVDIDNAKDLAELVGVTTDFGSLAHDHERAGRIDQQLRQGSIYCDNDNRILLSDTSGSYGVEIGVGGEARRFFEPADAPGLAFNTLELDEEYAIRLHNRSAHEVAVDLKIDGLSTFHFTVDAERKPDRTPRYKYWLVAPKSSVEIVGWYKSATLKSRFKITPVQDSAAAIAGLPLDDVGQVTATFHASWTRDSSRPADEPTIEQIKLTTRYVERIRLLPDGRKIMERVPVHQHQVGTGFGVEVIQPTAGVTRTIGVPRATIAFRYDRP